MHAQPAQPALLILVFYYTETRANLNCDLLSSWLQPPGSASCLRLDPLYYQARACHAQP